MRDLALATICSRALPAALLLLGQTAFSPFDAATPDFLLRWDAVHFLHVGRVGYVYEHEWAWFPGVPFLLSVHKLAPTLLSSLLAWDMTATMYALSLHHLKSPALGRLATLLSLLPSSPATLFIAPYTEPFFTYLSYKGMLFCAQSSYLLAALCFTAAAAFRANGFLLGGFIIWGLVVQPVLEGKKARVLECSILAAMTFLPFVAHNYAAYSAFCVATTAPAPWCTQRLPLVYQYVQRHYWDVGFLRYWTLQQLPNILIGLPPIAVIAIFSVRAISKLDATLLPHAIYALVMCAIYVFASHTQIVLRQAASLPIVYWAAAWLVVEHPEWGEVDDSSPLSFRKLIWEPLHALGSTLVPVGWTFCLWAPYPTVGTNPANRPRFIIVMRAVSRTRMRKLGYLLNLPNQTA
ncbi:GPI mannosyltransferase 2 [Mycena kentingensis (nom. inval.)]|nr:GPI mannosyltransferase 2 [Mycena kentingensis (nom. inval.)]